MPSPPASEFLDRIERGDFHSLAEDFGTGCQTWRRNEIEDYGDVILKLDEASQQGNEEARRELLGICHTGICYRRGPWRGMKKLFKNAEARQDAEDAD